MARTRWMTACTSSRNRSDRRHGSEARWTVPAAVGAATVRAARRQPRCSGRRVGGGSPAQFHLSRTRILAHRGHRRGEFTWRAAAGVQHHTSDRGGGECRARRDTRAIALDPRRQRDQRHVPAIGEHAGGTATRAGASECRAQRHSAGRGGARRAAHTIGVPDRQLQPRRRRRVDAVRHRAIPDRPRVRARAGRRPRGRAGQQRARTGSRGRPRPAGTGGCQL